MKKVRGGKRSAGRVRTGGNMRKPKGKEVVELQKS